MPVARSVSASQLARGGEGSITGLDGGGGGGVAALLAPKAHTLDRLAKPSMMNGHGEPRRKRPFMSFRLSKKSSKHKDGGGGGAREVSQNPGGGSGGSGGEGDVTLHQGNNTPTTISENGAESLDGGSDSSSASVKPKKKYLTRVSSFVSRVASKVQGGGGGGSPVGVPGAPNTNSRGRLERSKTISVSDLRTAKTEECVEFLEGRVPGVMGIRNHGNTCFINAVIQCLSHTDVLAEYFVLDQYKHDLARCNKINSKKYGTRGEITEQLAVLLKALWTLRYIPDLSMNFKNTVDKYESLYRGSQQHDAAEFLMFVLDKVHEDLNTASKRKYKKIKNTYGRPDEIVAAETLANHLRCNSSFIQEIFQAQFRSSLKCPHCQKESNTFDPFVCVSIPIPQRQVQAIFVCVVYLNQQPKQVQLGISMETTATIQDLRQQLAEDCGIPTGSLIITEVDGEGFHRTFADGSSVNVIGESDPLYAIELPPHKAPTQESGAFVLITWVNVVLADPENIRFGGVYQSQVVRDVSYVDLQKLLLKEMTNMVTNDTLTSEQESGLFLIGVDDGGSCVICLDPALDVPLFHECVEQALALCDPAAGPPHIKLVLQWTNQTKEKYIVDDVDHVDEHFSVKELKENPQQCASVSLHQCLQLHTSAEKLGCGDAWHCPTCNRKQQVVKRLMLWSAPQILVIHLKRFRQGTLQSNSSKLSTTVKFPLTGFDISEHVASKPNHTHPNGPADSGMLGGVWSPWKRPKRSVMHPEENVYDLYGVCYHHGKDMQGGHYTAMCKNTADNRWYSFDDSKVEAASEDQVVSPDAYILFYQRRSDSTLMSCSEGGLPEHWAFRIPISYLPPALALPAKENKVPAPPPAPFERGRSYGTLPVGARGQRQSSMEREHASDTEAPLASHEESPLLKRRSTSTLLEKEGSPAKETPKCNLKIETVKVDVVASQKKESESMECDTTLIPANPDSDEEMPEVLGKAATAATSASSTSTQTSTTISSKTVLISRCQAMRDTDLPDGAVTLTLTNGHAVKPGEEEEEEPDLSLLESRETEEQQQQQQTPEVRIHPATPEVLAAHQGHTDGHPKRSIITLTLRPRNPSESSCEARVVSRTPSLASSRSSSSVSSSGPMVNGVDVPYQNGGMDDEPHSSITPEIRITPLAKPSDGTGPLPPPVKVSTRCMNANKTASFVVINTPTASPRVPRPKTPVSAGYNGSPKPYSSSKVTVKTRDPSVESLRSQRPVTSSRKENGVSNKAPLSNGKVPSVSPAVNYCSPLKVTTTTTAGPRPHRPERGELRHSREARCDHREERYERRDDRFSREERYSREDKYDRHDRRDDRYDREDKYDKKEDKYDKREDRYERREDNRYSRREEKYDREHRYDIEKRYLREVRRHEGDSELLEKEYDSPQYRSGRCSADFRELREAWCKREYNFKYEDEPKCGRIFAYERDLDHPHHHKFGREGRYERDVMNDRGGGDIMGKGRASFDPRDHYRSQDYSKGLPSAATNPTPTPTVITESSV